MFKGAMVAIVTPFVNGEIDYVSLKELIEFQIKNGIDAIVPCGTTGESATLDFNEHERVIDYTIEVVAGRVPIIAGTGANNTEEAITLTKHAKKAGADGVLSVCPYYNKPTQKGLYEHFKAIAGAVDIPIILYNIPGRSVVNMTSETIGKLSEIDNIVGIKEASGSISQICDVIASCSEDFDVIAGDDFITFPLLCVGGKGVISVTSNIAPKEVADMCAAFFNGNFEEARRLHYKLWPLHNSMFIETNPIPIKTALSLMGKIKLEFRLPMTEMDEENLEKLKKVLSIYELIK